jgi:hypothetical protein
MKYTRHPAMVGCAAALVAALIWPSLASASSCGFVLHWDERTISDCIKEIKSEAFSLQLQVQTLTAENRALRGHLCLLAGALKDIGSTSNSTALVIEDSCAELKARATTKKSVTPTKKK